MRKARKKLLFLAAEMAVLRFMALPYSSFFSI
jgi:hypothetical protein